MKHKFTLLLALFSLTITTSVLAQTTVPALITSDQVWTISGSPYNITQNTYIDTNVSVIVMPGVEIISSSANHKLIVEGEFQALGTSDSMITMEQLVMYIAKPAKSYDPNTGEGFYLNYCEIEGLSSGKRNLEIYQIDFKIENCIFNDPYYGIYGSGSNNLHGVIESCTFTDTDGYGYPIYLSGSNNIIEIRDCEIYGGYGITLYGDITMENNLFDGARSITASSYNDMYIVCNHFINLSNGVDLNCYNYDSTASIIFNNNTIDSSGATSSNTMLDIYRSNTTYNFGTFQVNNNNFLFNNGGNIKVKLGGNNRTLTTYESLDLQQNYWGTTDSATIAGYIRDYSDDITIFAKADFSNYLSGQTSGCYNGSPSCDAYFSYTISGDTIYFEDESSSVNGNHTTSWSFGDGTSGSGSSVSHIYTTTGASFTICLTITDTATNCDDTYCYTVYLPFNSSCNAYFYTAIDTSSPYVIYIVNNSTGTTSNTNYYWTFGDGNGSSQQSPTHQYSNFGLHQICLTLYDSMNSCYSTFCDSVGVDSNGNLLKLESYKIIVLNEKDLLSIDKRENLLNMNVYPNPSTGLVNMDITTTSSEVCNMTIYSTSGKLIDSKEQQLVQGLNKLNWDLKTLKNGLYILNVSTESFSKSVKLFINH